MHADAIALAHAATTTHGHHGGHRVRRGWLRFAGHALEMTAAMLVGMAALTALFGMPHDSPIEVQALYMAAAMTLPMVGWMLVRGHSRRASLEMAVAMTLPLVFLLRLYRVGEISGDAVLDLQHVLMLPAMLGAMLFRRTEYGL